MKGLIASGTGMGTVAAPAALVTPGMKNSEQGAITPTSRNWFDDGQACQSFAFLPLRTAHTFGLLGLASDDVQRFYAGMGTMYLTRLAELASVATGRYLPPA